MPAADWHMQPLPVTAVAAIPAKGNAAPMVAEAVGATREPQALSPWSLGMLCSVVAGGVLCLLVPGWVRWTRRLQVQRVKLLMCPHLAQLVREQARLLGWAAQTEPHLEP